MSATDRDLANRGAELREMIDSRKEQTRLLRAREDRLRAEKADVDATYSTQMRRYDSAYLSQALEIERRRAKLTEEIKFLDRLGVLPAHVVSLRRRVEGLREQEAAIRAQLGEARKAAEDDLSNVELLRKLFLACLLRARIAGFSEDDVVSLKSPGFFPQVIGVTTGETAVTSFDTLGSGGKKTLFKCCFAVAVHRLARKLSAPLPTLLIIDTPMKNISERENRRQFEGFHEMLYELADSELQGTQVILIDKEYCPPEEQHAFSMAVRHMTVDKDEAPPLIPYYRERIVHDEPNTSEEQLDAGSEAETDAE